MFLKTKGCKWEKTLISFGVINPLFRAGVEANGKLNMVTK